MRQLSEDEKKIYKHIDIQTPAMQKLMRAQMERDPKDDSAYISFIKDTPVAKEAQCIKEDGTVDLNVRELSHEEAQFHEGVRRGRGAIIEKNRGDKSVSTLSQEKRERASNAFMERFSLDAIKNKFKAMMGSLFKPSHAEHVAEEMRKKI